MLFYFQYVAHEELERSTPNMEQEDDDKIDPLVSGYETNLSLFPDDFSSYELECLPYDFMCDLESTNKVAVNG
ncbi:hypothetical protein ANCCAN_08414 [Ancylostoma caninum]|uniref:Uncharacterized protein n=1 Tax=Ancylostoma caninum TaxID=29170 RepID=A0A368GQL1_ANCCA|nr:hypothetical protein ANCCAN_08414 [Ancylostoma caninum]